MLQCDHFGYMNVLIWLQSPITVSLWKEKISHFFPSPTISFPRSYGYHHSKWKVELLHKCPTYPLPRSELSTILTFPFTKIVLGRDKGRVLSLSWGLELKGIKDSQDELFLRLQSTWNKNVCAHIDQHRRTGRNLGGKPSNGQNTQSAWAFPVKPNKPSCTSRYIQSRWGNLNIWDVLQKSLT